MGCMGFGMRKEVYTRKPKTSFSQMRKIYGDHMEDFHKSKEVENKWSEKDKEEFRQFVTNKIKRQNTQESVYNVIIYFGFVIIIGLALYFACGD